MAPAPVAAVLAAVNGPTTQVTSRLEIYETDALTRWVGDTQGRLIDGSVTVDYDRDERRAFDLTLDNYDNALAHDPNGGFWYDKVLKLYKGITYQQEVGGNFVYQTVTWETQIGEFVIDQLSEAHFPHQLHVTGRDYTKRCLTSKFVTSTTFSAGQAIETLVRNIAALAGITKFLLPNTGKTVDRTFTYERGVERWKAMKEIADAYGYELFFDGQGYLVMREYKDPVYAPTSVVLSTGQAGNLVTYEKSTNDTRVYNHIVVTGESSDTSVAPVFAEALNNEPSSPTRIARLGDRLYEYTSSFITTVAQCQDTATKFLKIHALEEYDFNFSSIAYPWLEVGDIAQFIDPRPGVGDPDRFLMSTLSIPLKGGPMTGNAKRVTVVG